jgi:hypothetical protein
MLDLLFKEPQIDVPAGAEISTSAGSTDAQYFDDGHQTNGASKPDELGPRSLERGNVLPESFAECRKIHTLGRERPVPPWPAPARRSTAAAVRNRSDLVQGEHQPINVRAFANVE